MGSPTRTLTLPQARRVAIHAQGLARTGSQVRPTATPTMGHLQRVVDRVGLLQIDSVNVLARAHLLPAFSRIGPYDTGLIDRASRGTPSKPRRLMEYWAHVAAYVPPETFQLMRHRMRAYRSSRFVTSVLELHRDTYDKVLEVVAGTGPMTASQMHEALGHERGPKTGWGWNWTVAKQALEAAYFTGDLAVAHRNAQFERTYDLPERVLPPALLGAPELEADEAAVELLDIAARAHGIGTVRCFADYFRMSNATASRAVAALVGSGRLEPVTVTGWSRPLYLHAEAHVPRRTRARALLAPFDPLVFERRRLLELFDFHYRIGIYTPAEQRTEGYYVLPFLLGDELVGRTDLKADRTSGTLQVRTAFVEEGRRPAPEVAREMVAELAECARWLGLGRITIVDGATGTLVEPLHQAL